MKKHNVLKLIFALVLLLTAIFMLSACKPGESPISFKVNFVVDGEIVKTIDTSGKEVISLPENPAKENYTFDGWFWDKDTWLRPFTANSLLNEPLSSDMSVYAKFTENHIHSFTATVLEPTCTQQGYTTYTCSCGVSFIDDYVNALNHDYNSIKTEPTCTQQGYTTHTCLRCGDNYIDTYVHAIEHEFTDYVYDNNATYNADGTMTAACKHGCGATNTITAEGTKLTSGISFKTLSVDDDLNVYGKVANSQNTYSFIKEVEVKGNATFVVSTDIYGIQQVPTKTVPLEIGDNTFYITETVGNDIRLFTVVVRRRPFYTVMFDSKGGTEIDSQMIEEDSLINPPTTTKVGYTLNGWSYDLSKPITHDTTVSANWHANSDTPYSVEYYLENLEDNNYTLEETVTLFGTTDTTAVAGIKAYEHFTPITETVTGNINGDGKLILKVYYARNEYLVKVSANNTYITLTKTRNAKYKYGTTIEQTNVTFNNYLGYEWTGWHSDGSTLITED